MTVDMAAVQATCADLTVVPYVTGNHTISLSCFGCRKTSDTAPEEMLDGIPSAKLESIIRALEKVGAGSIPKSRAW